MKNSSRKINLLNMGLTEKKNMRVNKIKTTNVNILLNRVRQKKKKDFRRNLNFFSILILSLVVISTYSYII